ncbi:MAG TPA: carbon-nitrogen hydrolase family protein [Candidatus Eisenbergiella merdavium]|uniref:Carbon-nitrogen hydrolase family protein n=1 Tax=Candidatus Eisenbergiella merdavium TaxID=2838551 RepID=A0A9D2NH62_9FIRM|nr:carbon-nitrogen hydrolase family protein [Candidatus Eisenbergiella merdavium]
MRIGLYQFAGTNRISENMKHICRAIKGAAEQSVRLLVFQECALCGYPPIETSMEEIRPEEVETALRRIGELARQTHMFVAVGTVRFSENGRYNSLALFGENGSLLGFYDKRALWGWDEEHFTRGENPGIFEVDGIRIGFRICFDVRFPELFRQLYRERAELCFVAFSDTSKEPDPVRRNIISAHLITRAVENVMTVASVNTTSAWQTAPTAVFDCNGRMLKEAENGREGLLTYDYVTPQTTFGTKGRLVNNDFFLGEQGGNGKLC